MEKKSEKIQHFSNQLKNIEKDIDRLSRIKKLPFASLNLYNGSGDKSEILISDDLKDVLHGFVLAYFELEKEKVFDKMSKELIK